MYLHLSVSTNSKRFLLSFCAFESHLIFCSSSKSLSGSHFVILSQIPKKKSTKLYTLTVDFIALLKRVDSFTNSLNVSRAALEILSYCFSEGYCLTGLIICDKILLRSQKLYRVLVILKIGEFRGKKFVGGLI